MGMRDGEDVCDVSVDVDGCVCGRKGVKREGWVRER